MNKARALLKTARPKQWVKNVLVFAAPMAAGLFSWHVVADACIAFVCFVLAASGTYFLNDAIDHEADAQHPKKRFRPIAAGIIGVRTAYAISGICVIGSLAISALASGGELVILVAVYTALTISYSLYLKHEAVIDILVVAGCYVLRLVGGGAATDIPISNWFLVVAMFASLFVVAGKRYAEVLEMGEKRSSSRRVLQEYTPSFLRTAYGMAMSVAVAAYAQWAFVRADTNGSRVYFLLSTVAWVGALLRYALLLERGKGGAPEDLMSADRVLQVMGVVWCALFAAGAYGL